MPHVGNIGKEVKINFIAFLSGRLSALRACVDEFEPPNSSNILR